MSSEHFQNNFKCVDSTGHAFRKTIREYNEDQSLSKRRRIGNNGNQSNLFRSAQFSADGTSIVTQSEDECLRTFVLPPDLLDGSEEPSALEPYSDSQSPSNTLAYSLYPGFDLQNPSTTLVLEASRDVPLQLRNILQYETLHASYPLIDATNEAYLTPHSLAWTADGTHFIAGTKDQLSIFDVSYDGQGPATTHRTAPGRTAKKLYGAQDINNCKGIISALSISRSGLLAAGTLDRNIGLFDQNGFGEYGTAFSVASEAGVKNGTGITHLRWSPCEKYLLVAERQSDSVLVYDVRTMHQQVGWLSGRRAETTQKLGIDVVATGEGFEVWSGGTDGGVRMWENPGLIEGEQRPMEVSMLHDDLVSSAIWHPSGEVLATTSGRRTFAQLRDDFDSDCSDSDSDSDSDSSEASEARSPLDNTLRIWTR